jgi:predicted Zn-dependent protease
MRFTHGPGLGASTLVVKPGAGGTDEELAEAAGDGIWLQQLGWASPDPISGAFGGEIRIGYRIRNGKIAEPVRGGTIGGTVVAPPDSPSLLASVAAVGSRATLVDDLSSPTLLIRTLTVAGENAPGTST